MQVISLSKIENQSFFVIVDGVQIDFRLHYFRSVLYADITIDETLIGGSIRCTARGWLLPKVYQKKYGNFMFVTADNEYPDAQNFDETCFLCHYTDDEVKELGYV